MSVSFILPWSSSDLDTDHGAIIDETIKQVAWSINVMLLKTTTGNPTNNVPLSDDLRNRTPDRQSVPTLNQHDVHRQTKTPQTDQIHMRTALHIQLQILSKLSKS